MKRARRRRRRIESAATVVTDFARKYELTDRIHERHLCELWPDIVGEAAAGQSAAVELAHGTLHVVVESPVWLTQLRKMRAEILERVRSHARIPIRSVRFRVGVLPAPAEVEKAVQNVAPELSAQQKADAAEGSRVVQDPELRQVVRRALEAHKRWTQSE